jgi:DEK C terminal domain
VRTEEFKKHNCFTKKGAMLDAETVRSELRNLLPTLPLDHTTERQIRALLEESLGESVADHKPLIKANLSFIKFPSSCRSQLSVLRMMPSQKTGRDRSLSQDGGVV